MSALKRRCCALSENDPHRLAYSNTRSLIGGHVGEGLGDEVMFEH